MNAASSPNSRQMQANSTGNSITDQLLVYTPASIVCSDCGSKLSGWTCDNCTYSQSKEVAVCDVNNNSTIDLTEKPKLPRPLPRRQFPVPTKLFVAEDATTKPPLGSMQFRSPTAPSKHQPPPVPKPRRHLPPPVASKPPPVASKPPRAPPKPPPVASKPPTVAPKPPPVASKPPTVAPKPPPPRRPAKPPSPSEKPALPSSQVSSAKSTLFTNPSTNPTITSLGKFIFAQLPSFANVIPTLSPPLPVKPQLPSAATSPDSSADPSPSQFPAPVALHQLPPSTSAAAKPTNNLNMRATTSPHSDYSKGVTTPPYSDYSKGARTPPHSGYSKGVTTPTYSDCSKGVATPPPSDYSKGVTTPPHSDYSKDSTSTIAPKKGFHFRQRLKRRTSVQSKKKRQKHEKRLTLKVKEVERLSTENKTKFEDAEFPTTDTSLLMESGSLPPSLKGDSAVVAWLRPNDVRVRGEDSHLNWTLFNTPESADIVQGVLGNCWFASALSVVAENRKILERIFVTKEYNPLGVYGMRLCKDGQWTDVLIDDRLPCRRDGSLVFCKGKRKQLWVPLLEKALAKVYGSYGALISGNAHEGLTTLTGFPCESYNFERLVNGKDMLWEKLSSKECTQLMGCSCGQRSISEAKFTQVGLVSNHAYSILDVRLVHGERLLRLRNTWGRFAWNGDWSEDSKRWKKIPEETKSKLETKGASEGLFWISFSDWFKYFNAVDVCTVKEDWYETRATGSFLTGNQNRLTISRLSLLNQTKVDLSLHQKSSRADRSYQIVDLMILVYDDQWQLVAYSNRVLRTYVTCSAILEPGCYSIYCLSFSQWLSENAVEYTLVCHSHQPVDLEEKDLPKETAGLALVHLALAKGESAARDKEGTMYTYILNKDWAGSLTLAVNNNPTKYFHFKTNIEKSVNYVNTRGITTVDIIPPLHRQILNISTQKERKACSLQSNYSFMSSNKQRLDSYGVSSAHTPPITTLTHSIHRLLPAK